MTRSKFTAPWGSREIYFDGKPFITIHRENDLLPYYTDDLSREILKLLNKSRTAKKIAMGKK